MGRLQRFLDEQAYEDVKLWIRKITHDFHRKNGGDFYELLAEANFLFARWLPDYDPTKSALTNYLHSRIRGGLYDYVKQRRKHPELYLEDLSATTFNTVYRTRNDTFLPDLLDEIGRDARIVVQQILQPDPILMMILERNDNGLRHVRRGLREYLVSKLEWTHNRIDSAFWDITQALWNIPRFKRL